MKQPAILETNFSLPGQTAFYRGKVRDIYYCGDLLVAVASDRISAFDHILPRPIPHKGMLLNTIASHFLDLAESIVPTWKIASPDPNVTIGWRCEPIKIEMVIRGYLTGHAWRVYRDGGRQLCGVQLPDGMRENDRFDQPIITPATKADEGHDEDISAEEIIDRQIVSEASYRKLETYTRELFGMGTQNATKNGLILVDTKYEFGMKDGRIHLIDELHTPDSSRYFFADSYAQLQGAGKPQRHLSKEFARQWLIEQGFQGMDGQEMPKLRDDFVNSVSSRYIELFELLMAYSPKLNVGENMHQRIEKAVTDFLNNR